jgi:lipoprotein-anchoring transpeptidase ErfK/SrfK
MQRQLLAALVVAASILPAQAQYWGYWGAPYPRGYGAPYPRGYYEDQRAYPRANPYWDGWGFGEEDRYRAPMQSGGERPLIAPLAPAKIAFPSNFPVNSIVIDTGGRQLFLVLSTSAALRYQISVGREGFAWEGRETISRKAEWPDWYPPEEMRERDPRLPEKMTGGLKNPLGAMALYLGKTLYRIHGTNDAKSIGRAASSGCFRMLNGHIIDLASRVDIGTVVTVVKRLPPELARIVADQVNPPRPAAAEGVPPS